VTVISRSALVAWGKNPSPSTAYIVADHTGRRVVTWDEVLRLRRERQAITLDLKRRSTARRAYKLWVGYYDQTIMGGWHAFLEDWRGAPYRIWIDRDLKWFEPLAMQAFPLLLDLFDGRQQWELWKRSFARRFERRRQCGEPLGVAFVWWDRSDSVRSAGGGR
jgi:hypothetical protein